MKNKKSQTLGIAIVVAIIVFIIGMTIINFVKDEVTRARVDLECSDADNISDGNKLVCLIVDTTVPYWILIVFSITIGGITSRLTL